MNARKAWQCVVALLFWVVMAAAVLVFVLFMTKTARAQGTLNGSGFSCLISAWDESYPGGVHRCGSIQEAAAYRNVQVVFRNRIGTFMRHGTATGDWPEFEAVMADGGPAGMGYRPIELNGVVRYRDGEYRSALITVTAWPRGVPYTLEEPSATWASPGYADVCESVRPNTPCMYDAWEQVAERGWSASEPLAVLASGGTVTIPLGVASDVFDTLTEQEQETLGWTWLAMEMRVPGAAWTFLHGQATLRLSLVDVPAYEHPDSGWVGVPLSQKANPVLVIPAAMHRHMHADLDRDGAVGVPDVFCFFVAWFAGNAAGDWDASGGCETTDIFAFLAEWFEGQ